MYRPGGADREPRVQQRRAKGVPGIYPLVGEHNSENALWLENPGGFPKRTLEQILIVRVGQLYGRLALSHLPPAFASWSYILKKRRVSDNLVLLVSEHEIDKFRPSVTE